MPTDAEVVVAARAGDLDAFASIYDRYASRLYDFCSSVVRDSDTAAETVLNTFVLVALDLFRLRRPNKLEPWLFAMTRDQLLYRERPNPLPASLEGIGSEPVEAPTLAPPVTGRASAGDDVPQPTAVVWEAAASLPERDRVLLDLHLRHHLERDQLADALGISIAHAHALVGQLEFRVGRLLGALLVARVSASDCAARARVLRRWDGRITYHWLRRIARHVDRCTVCGAARAELPDALQLLAAVPHEEAPRELRDEVLYRVDLLLAEAALPEPDAPAYGESSDVVAEGDELEEIDERGTTSGNGEVAENVAGDEANNAPGDEVEFGDEFDGELGDELGDDEVVIAPAPVPMRGDGFPKPMFPRRQRFVVWGTLVLAVLLVAASVFDFRGFGSAPSGLLAAGAAPPSTRPAPTVPTSTAPPTTARGPDTVPPFVFGLGTQYGCIGSKHPTTDALVSVVDDRDVKDVTLVATHSVEGQSLRKMTSDGTQEYRAQIGPYRSDGLVGWVVFATDTSNNLRAAIGQPVAVSNASC